MAQVQDTYEPMTFDAIRIGLASPEKILEWSHGEVKKPETINYRTLKPEKDGLFCERIFGPTKDWECHCGKYKKIRFKGVVCDRCGVEVTKASVRRERLGHIALAAPVSHIWYFKGIPSRMGLILDISPRVLEKVLYFASYIVLDPGDTGLQYKEVLSEKEYRDEIEKYGADAFRAGMGAEAVLELLKAIDLDKEAEELKKELKDSSGQKRARIVKRLEVVEAFRASGNKPEWMVMTVIPVIPPDLRPMVQLDGGRFATSDLNDLYRRIINRNNRLARLLELGAPEIIVRNEKRMLQEAVDALIDNGRRGRPVTGPGNRALKSLSDLLKGKQGRFRQNLLGKRVDYSGRSVIVVGPELKIYQCGLPKEMAIELFKPFVMKELVQNGTAHNIKSAKKMVERMEPAVWDVLEDVIKEHPVMLNRAPTLHRLGIQAFEPILVEGKAIKLHPLVCTAFNADFDGDQMAVHLPLSVEAQAECRFMLLSPNNLLKPSDGGVVAVPSQDMVLGIYYLTQERPGSKGEGMLFKSVNEAILAYENGEVTLHSKVKTRIHRVMEDGTERTGIVETTVGRLIFNEIIPQDLGFVDRSKEENLLLPEIDFLVKKGGLKEILERIMRIHGATETAVALDNIKAIGYKYSTRAAMTVSISDMVVPENKQQLLDDTQKLVDSFAMDKEMGLLTEEERYKQVINAWKETDDELTRELLAGLSDYNNLKMMADSGARGSTQQIKQLCGMRGLMAKPQKSGAQGAEIIENPIISNLKEGMTVLEYFISTHGARKGLADTALKTADAGYLTRRLVDVSHDVIINEEDCGTLRGLIATAIKSKDEIVESLGERILGRTSVHDIFNPLTGELILPAGEEITEDIASLIESLPIEQVEIRSVLTCESRKGVCAKCYGRNLASGRMVEKGEVVGVIAAQSIGEPGTQLTLRTFHVGGTASSTASESSITSKYEGKLEYEELRTIERIGDDGSVQNVVVSRTTELRITDENTGITYSQYDVPYGSILYKKDGEKVKKGDLICEWDAYNAITIIEAAGKARFDSMIDGVTFREEMADEYSLNRDKVIIESRDKSKNPTISIVDENGEIKKQYNLPVGAHVMVNDGDDLKIGDIIIKIPRAIGKSSDITGGLPRVTELFEARNPSNPAIVSEINGEVIMGKIKRGNREIIIKNKSGQEKRYLVPLTKQILVQENDYVKAGMRLSDGAVSPTDILDILGPIKVQEYIVNEIQEVYRLQGVKINDKHFEIIVRQMMRKVQINDPGDTDFLPEELVDKWVFMDTNDNIYGKFIITDAGDSETYSVGQIISAREMRSENSSLERQGRKMMTLREAKPATASQVLQGITRAALKTNSFISAASFQETTKVLSEAAIRGRVDNLEGLKENVICGHAIPAGTGQKEFQEILVAPMEEYQKAMSDL